MDLNALCANVNALSANVNALSSANLNALSANLNFPQAQNADLVAVHFRFEADAARKHYAGAPEAFVERLVEAVRFGFRFGHSDLVVQI